MKRVLLRCIHLLTATVGVDAAVNAFLNELGTYYDAERTYIFEYSQDGLKLSNTFEWCAKGVKAQKNMLQNLDMQVVAEWNHLFEARGEFSISSVSTDVDENTETRRLLEMQGVNSLMAAPLRMNGKLVGFLGADNPRKNRTDMQLLRATGDVVTVELSKRRMLSELDRMSYTDMLTGVRNRNAYIRDLNIYYENQPQTLGIVMIDINGLKTVNDRYGHRHGDAMIVRTAEILKNNLHHTVYRVGGDEFIIPCPNVSEEDFNMLCARLREAFEREKAISVSFGCSWKGTEINIDQQIANADELMYADKELHYHDAFMDGTLLNRKNRTVNLLNEIAQGHFLVYYQPQVDIHTGEIVGAEALVRKTDETGRLIPPDRFVPIYEAQGLMVQVDLFVLETVLKMLLKWPDTKKPQISVNFSRSTLLLPDFVDKLTGIFRRYNVPCDAVILEVTERAAQVNDGSLKDLIPNIRRQGFRVSLDDFGMEYSNLALLASIGVDELKLDRSLVNGICKDERRRIVIESVIYMCNRLGGMSVIAEGVETEDQRRLLESFGCDRGQGWLFYKPMPQEEFIQKMLEESCVFRRPD